VAWNLRASDAYPKQVGDTSYQIVFGNGTYLLNKEQAEEWISVCAWKILDDRFAEKRRLLTDWGFLPPAKYLDRQMTL